MAVGEDGCTLSVSWIDENSLVTPFTGPFDLFDVPIMYQFDIIPDHLKWSSWVAIEEHYCGCTKYLRDDWQMIADGDILIAPSLLTPGTL